MHYHVCLSAWHRRCFLFVSAFPCGEKAFLQTFSGCSEPGLILAGIRLIFPDLPLRLLSSLYHLLCLRSKIVPHCPVLLTPCAVVSFPFQDRRYCGVFWGTVSYYLVTILASVFFFFFF